MMINVGRVEYWRGGIRTMGETVAGSFRRTLVPHSKPSLRFKQPLIKPSVPFSGTRLTDEIMHSPTEGGPRLHKAKQTVEVIQTLIREIHRFPALRLVFP